MKGIRQYVPRIVPWRTWDEWSEVKRALFSQSSVIDRANGVQRIRVWQSRCKIPHSIEATAALIEINLAQERFGSNSESGEVYSDPVPGMRSDEELRLMYSMALLRLVNGIVDAFQQKKFASPVSDLAEQLALPRVLVDVRHAATHNQLPTLATLQHAADLGLAWLREKYWDAQGALLEQHRDAALAPLKQHIKMRSKMLAVERKLLRKKQPETREKLEGVLRQCRAAASAHLAAVVACTPLTSVEPALVPHVVALAEAAFLQMRADAAAARAETAAAAGAETEQGADARACAEQVLEQDACACAEQVLALLDEAVARMAAAWRVFRPALLAAVARRYCALVAAASTGAARRAEETGGGRGFEDAGGDVCGLGAHAGDDVRPLLGTWAARLLRCGGPPPDGALLRATLRAALADGGARAAGIARAVYGNDPGLAPPGGGPRMAEDLAVLLERLGPDGPQPANEPGGPEGVDRPGPELAAIARFAAGLRQPPRPAAPAPGRWERAGWWAECALGAVLGPAPLELPAAADGGPGARGGRAPAQPKYGGMLRVARAPTGPAGGGEGGGSGGGGGGAEWDATAAAAAAGDAAAAGGETLDDAGRGTGGAQGGTGLAAALARCDAKAVAAAADMVRLLA